MRDEVAKNRRLQHRVRERLEALVKRSGLRQEDLERATGYRQSDISRFFTDKMKHPPLEFMNALALVFSLTLADLLREELPRPSLTEKETALLAAYRAMPTEQRAALELLLRPPKKAGSGRARG